MEKVREYAEVCFVPNSLASSKTGYEFRYIATREALHEQGVLPGMAEQEYPFPVEALGNRRYKIHAVVTSRTLPAEELLPWYYKRCGHSEEVHAILKKICDLPVATMSGIRIIPLGFYRRGAPKNRESRKKQWQNNLNYSFSIAGVERTSKKFHARNSGRAREAHWKKRVVDSGPSPALPKITAYFTLPPEREAPRQKSV